MTYNVGDVVICEYPDYSADDDGDEKFEFTGTIVSLPHSGNGYGIKVHLGTGHKEEENLHELVAYSASGFHVTLLPEGGGWWIDEKEIVGPAYKMMEYDPAQQGDNDDDI